MLKRLAALSIGVGLTLTGSAEAQEHNLPALNAFGRFWGMGWSNGYHAGAYDGRFQHIKDSHPASMYGSNALLYPYHPGYEPHRPFMQPSPTHLQPVYSTNGDTQAFGSILHQPTNAAPNGFNQSAPVAAPPVPPKPVEPPPTWLRPFLKDDAKSNVEELKPEKAEEIQAEEASPSDLLKPKTTLPKTTKEAPAKETPAKASDDDDLLTLTPPKSAFERYNEARRKQGSNR